MNIPNQSPKGLISTCIRELKDSLSLENGICRSVAARGNDSIHDMDVYRMEHLWSELAQLSIPINLPSGAIDDAWTPVLEIFVDEISFQIDEALIIKLLWSLDCAIERGWFSPKIVATTLLSKPADETRTFLRCIFRFLLKLVFFLDYKSNRLVFSKTIEKYTELFAAAGEEIAPESRDLCPAVDLIQVLLCREINLLPAYFTMHELNTKFKCEPATRPPKLIEPEVIRFMNGFNYPLRILYSYYELDMCPFAGITLASHPAFQIDRDQLTLCMIKSARLLPPAFKAQQLHFTCNLLGQLRCTQLASGLLVNVGRQVAMPVVAAISELIFAVMEIIEETKCIDWAMNMFSHLADLVICFVLDQVVRLNAIISKLNSKLDGRAWIISRHYVMWFTLVCMSGFVGKNKLSDFVSCLRLFDSLFPEADELDASAMEHISSLLLSSTSENSDANAVDVTENGDGSNDDCPKETEMKKKVSLAITLQRLEAMARDPYRRFLLFSPNELFGIERREECDDDDDEDEDENCTFDDETGNLRTDEEVVGAKTEALIERNGEETEEQNEVFDNTGYVEAAKRPKMSPPLAPSPTGMTQDLRHLVAAAVCAWEVVLEMNRGAVSVDALRRVGAVEDGHLPRGIPPLLYPLQAQIADWWEQLDDACSGCGSAGLIDDSVDGGQKPTTVEKISWLEFIVTLNTYSPNVNSQKILGSVVDAFWLPSNDCDTGIGAGLPLDNGRFSLPYGLSGCGRLRPLSHRLIRKMSVHLQMVFCNVMRQKLCYIMPHGLKLTPGSSPNMKLTPGPFAGYVCLPSPATLETFSRLLSCQVEKSLMRSILVLYERLLENQTTTSIIPLYRPVNESTPPASTEPHDSNDEFSAFLFWFDLLGHRLVDALADQHRLTYLDNLFHRFELTSQEHAYALDWTIVRFSRRILTPNCSLYSLTNWFQSHKEPTGVGDLLAPAGHCQVSRAHPLEVTSCVILLTTLQAVCAFDLLDFEGAVRHLIEKQQACTTTLSIYDPSVSGSPLALPFTVVRRLTDLQVRDITNPFLMPSTPDVPATAAVPQTPLFDTEGNPLNPEERFLTSVYSQYNSCRSGTTADESTEQALASLASDTEIGLCVVLMAIFNNNLPLPLNLINKFLILPPDTMNLQIKALCEYLVLVVCKHEDFKLARQSPPEYLPHPRQLLDALLTFCIQYHIVTMDRLLLFLFTRSNQSGRDVGAAHCIAIFLITQCPQLATAIDAVKQFSPKVPDIVSSRQWPDLLRRLHEILPEKQIIRLTSPTDGGEALLVARRHPCQPIYYDHLVLRMVPVLEIILTSFLDNPPPLHQLARFCDTVAPLFRFHSNPMSLCFVLLRGQFRHFWSGSGSRGGLGSGGVGGLLMTPTTPSVFYPLQRRNPTEIDRVVGHLLVRCILCLHQSFAVRANINRPCAQAFSTTTATNTTETAAVEVRKNVTGLLSPTAWTLLDSLHTSSLQRSSSSSTPSEPSFTTRVNFDTELTEAEALNWDSDCVYKQPVDHLERLLEPVVKCTEKFGLSGSPSAWRAWRTEECVNPQAAGIYAVAIELMVLFSSPAPSRFSLLANSLVACLDKRSGDDNFPSWLNVTGALVSILPAIFRQSILRCTCSLFNDPLFTDTELWSSNLLTVKPSNPMGLLRAFRQRRALSGQPTPLTFFRSDVSDPEDARFCHLDDPDRWENLGRPHTNAVRFFESILPEKFNGNGRMPDHLLRASIWHAIWRHANLCESPTLTQIYEEHIKKHVNNEAKLLMAFYLTTPVMNATNIANSPKVVDMTGHLYRAVSDVDMALAAVDIPMYHIDTIADLLYHIKYTFVGNVVRDSVEKTLPTMRPRLQACLKFVLSAVAPPPNPTSNLPPPWHPVRASNGQGFSTSTVLAVYEDRAYQAAKRPPLRGEDTF